MCTMYDFISDRKCMCTCILIDFDVHEINGLPVTQCVTVEWLASGKHIYVYWTHAENFIKISFGTKKL